MIKIILLLWINIYESNNILTMTQSEIILSKFSFAVLFHNSKDYSIFNLNLKFIFKDTAFWGFKCL